MRWLRLPTTPRRPRRVVRYGVSPAAGAGSFVQLVFQPSKASTATLAGSRRQLSRLSPQQCCRPPLLRSVVSPLSASRVRSPSSAVRLPVPLPPPLSTESALHPRASRSPLPRGQFLPTSTLVSKEWVHRPVDKTDTSRHRASERRSSRIFLEEQVPR